MIVVDASGSTQTDDPNATMRTTAVTDFINSNSSLASLTYSYTYFAKYVSTYDYSTAGFPDSTNVPTTTFRPASEALNAVTAFSALFNNNRPYTIARDGTNYVETLEQINALILHDANANPGYNYAVIFMSDGAPTTPSGYTTASTLDPLVTQYVIESEGSSRVTLSTVYFSTSPDSSDETLLDSMAEVGNGISYNLDTESMNLTTISQLIQGIITPPPSSCSGSSSSSGSGSGS